MLASQAWERFYHKSKIVIHILSRMPPAIFMPMHERNYGIMELETLALV